MTQRDIRVRPRSKAVEAAAQGLGYSALQSQIIAGRLADHQAGHLQRQIRPQITDLDAPDALPDIDKAASRIAGAVIAGEPILCVTDHDCDGVTGHHVIRGTLIDYFQHPAERTHSFISHRLKEGYGISEGVVDRIAAAGHDRGVLVSADQGSSDEPRIARLRSMGIETVVTDHHGVEGQGPGSAVAVVNPCREDSVFPDKFIAGCHVAWLTMAATRRELIRRGHLSPECPHLTEFFPTLALGTTADCVSFSRSRNNRLIVQRGLHQINSKPSPAWQAWQEVRGGDEPFTTETLAFFCGPQVNARGRVDEAMLGVRFLRAATLEQARRMVAQLQAANEERKEIERTLKEAATVIAHRQIASGAHGLAVWLPQGNSGVHGIVASRLVEAFGRPTLCISPKLGHPGVVSASARTIAGFHVRDAFAWIDQQLPGLLKAWGGHEGAGGLTLLEEGIPVLQALWDQAVIHAGVAVGPSVLTDGPLPRAPDFGLLTEIAQLEPYGREFDAPVFSQDAVVAAARPVGADGKHVQLTLELFGRQVRGIWFNVPELDWRLEPGAPVTAVFGLGSNTFRGDTALQCMVNHLQPRKV